MHSKIVISYELMCESGLRIGGGNTSVDIGGIDAPVIKDPISRLPYLPGSSIKGKMRSLYEWLMYSDELVNQTKGKPIAFGEVAKVFGTANNDQSKGDGKNIIISRGIFSNAYLKKTNADYIEERLGKGLFTEVKPENVIDRLTSKATPRFFEQVPRGAVFCGEIILTIYDEGEREEVLSVVRTSMKLLEDSYLGGGGSRGSGKVRFMNIQAQERLKTYYTQGESGTDITTEFQNLTCEE